MPVDCVLDRSPPGGVSDELLLVAHVHNQPGEFDRLYASIARCPLLQGVPLLVINNASLAERRAAVSRIAGAVSDRQCVEVNPGTWHRLRVELEAASDGDAAVVLFELELGREGWSVHHARNVGLVAARHCFPNRHYGLHLDSDIVVPAQFELGTQAWQSLTCLKLTGCPDLSRLEWVALALFLSCRRYGLPYDERCQRYSAELASTLDGDAAEAILARYTSLTNGPIDRSMPAAWFPTREEYHGACFIAERERLEQYPFPSWFDNDWFVFQELRGPDAPVEFLPGHVEHQSAPKKVLDRPMLLREELGKIVNRLHQCANSDDQRTVSHALSASTSERLAILRYLHGLACEVERAAPAPGARALAARSAVALEWLAWALRSGAARNAPADLAAYRDHKRRWRAWIASHPANDLPPPRGMGRS